MSIHHASLWLLLFFFFSLHYWLLFFFHQSWPLLPTIRTIHWSPDTWSPFTEPQTRCSLSLEAPTPPSPHLPANCYSFSTSQDRYNFPSWVFVLMTFSWNLTPLPLPPLKKKNQMTNQMTLYLVYMSVSSCQWALAWQKTPLSFGNPIPCRVPDWSKGSIIDFWVCVLHTEAIGGGWKRRIFLPILLLLSRETSISDFSFHVAVSFFIKRSFISKVTIIFIL